MSPPRILELFKTPEPRRDIEWLKKALQFALQLEFFTIPPYLTAMWSIKNPRDAVSIAIREIVVEEMLHMSLVCNLIVSIGGRPRIYGQDVVPSYPRPLPGGVKPWLRVSLEGLSQHSLKTFMEIEEPEKDISSLEATFETIPRIGALYDLVWEAFDRIKPPMSRSGQIEGYFGESQSDSYETPKNIGTLEEAEAVIRLIKDQGEGSLQAPYGNKDSELAHYYRFKEVAVGRRIVKTSTGEWIHSGESVSFPDCWPVAEVPDGGYVESDVPNETWQLMAEFDAIYSQVIMNLDEAWSQKSQGAFHRSLELMMDKLPTLARKIMQVPIRQQPFNYSPCFRLVDR